MKKTILFLIMAAGLLSCAKVMTPAPEKAPAGVPMTFNITVTGTKAAKTSWEDGDEIVLFFKGIENNYILFSYNEETQEWDERISYDTFTSSDFENLEENILSAVHLPGISSITLEDGYFSFFGKDEKPIFNYYLAQTGVPYTVDGTTVSASFTMEKPEGFVQFHVAGIEKTVNNYTFASPQVRPVALSGINFDGTLREEVLQAGARLSGFADADGAVFAGRLAKAGTRAAAMPNYTFSLASDEKIYSYNVYDKTLEAGKRYNLPAPTKWSVQNASDLVVDMGLSVKWAKCNLGTDSPEEYGNYFAWGETTGYNEGKTSFTWNIYAWGTGQTAITKYCSKSGFGKDGFTDRRTTLEKTDDAAYAALGGKFRMPTDEEWIELLKTKTDVENYTWTWCDGSSEKYNGTNVNGWKIVKNSSSATLFIPAAGFMNTGANGVNSRCYYWSSSLDTDLPYDAWYVSILFQKPGVYMSDGQRAIGLSVRPVWK